MAHGPAGHSGASGGPRDLSATTVVSGLSGLRSLHGVDLGAATWQSINQAEVDTFARLTHDWQWIHNDPERAASGPFGSTILHGFFTLALAPRFLSELLRVEDVSLVVNYGLDRVRFPAPAHVGEDLRGRASVTDVVETGNGLQVTIVLTIESRRADKPVCIAHFLSRYWH